MSTKKSIGLGVERSKSSTPSAPNLKGPQFVKTTLKELGPCLPIGISHSGSIHRDFSFKRWNLKTEKQISNLQGKSGQYTIGEYVLRVLSMTLNSLGNLDILPMHEKKIIEVLSGAFYADIMYMYLYLRYTSKGNSFRVQSMCPVCRNMHAPEFFFDTLDVERIEPENYSSLDDLKKVYKFLEGNELEIGDKKISELVIIPSKWNIYNGIKPLPGGQISKGDLIERTILNGVVGAVDNSTFVINRDIVENMTSQQYENLFVKLFDLMGGPEILLNIVCPAGSCGQSYQQMIDWRSPDFFTVSSS